MYTVGLNWYEMEMNRTLYRNIFIKDSTKLISIKNTVGPRPSIVYLIPLQSKPIIGLIEFFPIFFSILFKFSNW